MANELWISDATGFHGWIVDAEGNASTETDYEPETSQRFTIGVEGIFNRAQADTIRGLIAELVETGFLAAYPNKGVQYPTGVINESWAPTLRYLRSWPDDTDATTDADSGLSTECPWVPPAHTEEEPVNIEPEGTETPGQVTISEGDEHELVTEWQAICNEILMDTETEEDYFLEVDGHFGSETRKTTKLVQSILDLPVTGQVDQATWEAIS